MIGAFMFFAALIMGHAAVLMALSICQVSMVWSCLGLGALDILVGAYFMCLYGKRHPQSGKAFEGTQSEIRRSLEWIRNLF
jgi:hypothetical protein